MIDYIDTGPNELLERRVKSLEKQVDFLINFIQTRMSYKAFDAVSEWLEKKKLTYGTHFIPVHLLYDCYRKESWNNISLIDFSRRLSSALPSESRAKQTYKGQQYRGYMLSLSIAEILTTLEGMSK